MTKIAAPDFDLAMTLNSGQVFHWEKHCNGFIGAIGDSGIYAEQRSKILRVAAADPRAEPANVRRLIEHYFALDHRLDEICSSFPDDARLSTAREFCRGLRIIRQPKWECLATFICSSMKQVAHIRQISLALRKRFGQAQTICGRKVFTFPTAERIAKASEQQLRDCALGYRAKNLRATARLIPRGEANLERWSKLTDEQLRENLCELPGVGAKVANCVMLFAYERISAFPIDVWIARVLRENYFPRRRKVSEKKLAEFAATHFGKFGGYAQQYLFHHARVTANRRRKRQSVRRSGRKLRGF